MCTEDSKCDSEEAVTSHQVYVSASHLWIRQLQLSLKSMLSEGQRKMPLTEEFKKHVQNQFNLGFTYREVAVDVVKKFLNLDIECTYPVDELDKDVQDTIWQEHFMISVVTKFPNVINVEDASVNWELINPMREAGDTTEQAAIKYLNLIFPGWEKDSSEPHDFITFHEVFPDPNALLQKMISMLLTGKPAM